MSTLFAAWLMLSTCFQADIKTYCCPSACAAKKSSHWYQADGVLRGCMKGLGCGGSDSASVSSKCSC